MLLFVLVLTTWPAGSYELPRPTGGCPDGHIFQWIESNRHHDSEDDDNANFWSPSNHFTGVGRDINQGFCIKTQGGSGVWPAGEYCIYRRGGCCYQGFDQGSIHWDDEDDDNANSVNGYLPDGDYGRDTRIEFCCRIDGHPYTEISLPITKSFYLLRKRLECQRAKCNILTYKWHII